MTFVLWDKVRLFMKRGNIYNHENLFQNQSDPKRVFSGRDIPDLTDPNFILEQTNVQINRMERYKDYDQMDEVGEISLALDMYADEASLRDPERNHSVFIKTQSKRLKDEIEEFLYDTINIDAQVRPITRYLSKYGDLPIELVPTHNRDGLSSFRVMPVYNFTRAETKYGDLVGFFYQEDDGGSPEYYHPWQVVHMRLTSFEKIFHPYGKCVNVDSRIKTPSGSVSLKDIKIGDEVYSFDISNQKPVITTVLNKVLNGKKKTLIIKTKHRSITVTPEHPILAVVKNNFIDNKVLEIKQYILAKDLANGDKLISPKFNNENNSSDDYLVESIISIEDGGEIEVGDIQVSEHSNFVADGIVVHNSILDGARRDFRRLRLMEDAALVYRLCLRGDSKVWTPNGYKEIKDINIGDKVYCFSEDQKVTETKVINWVCNGRDKIYRVFSRHREIFANSTHPILVVSPYKVDGILKYDRQEYVDVQDLKTLQNTGKEYCHRFLLPIIENVNYVELVMPDVPKYIRLNKPIGLLSIADEYKKALIGTKKDAKEFLNCERDLVIEKANVLCNSICEAEYSVINGWVFDSKKRRAKEFKINTIATEEFAQWFGFMIGDGFVSERRSINGSIVRQVGFALGDDHNTNEKYKKLFEKIIDSEVSFDNDTGHRLGSYYVYSVHFLNFMKLNGFIPGANNKRIPSWVYQSPRSVQEAFIDGYIDADGHRRTITGGITESCECSCCNRELLEDIKELCHRLGWNVGIIGKHEKKGGHIIDEDTGRIMPDTVAWSLYFTKDNAPEHERILGVEEIEDDEIYDITVENEVHNILVDGIVTAQTRAPEKRMFKVPVGNLPPKEREQYLQIIARRFKKHKFIDPTTGALNERYAPHIQDDDYWVPVTGDGQGVEVETLQGAENLDAIADIEYFKKKMIAALKIPFHRVGLGDASGDTGKSIASQSPEFSKAVQWIQDQIIVGIKKMVLVHLTLRGFTVEDMRDFELGMTSASAIDELYRIETWLSRVDIMGGIKELGIFPDEWIVERFTDMTADELELIKRMKKLSGEAEQSDNEETEEFFESKKCNKLLLEFQIKELHDKYVSLKEEKQKYSHISSFQKMINESEFDGIGDEEYMDDDKNKAKLIIENILTDKYLLEYDENHDVEDQEMEDELSYT